MDKRVEETNVEDELPVPDISEEIAVSKNLTLRLENIELNGGNMISSSYLE